jgi:DNA-binding transcriptional ArsR family regulator
MNVHELAAIFKALSDPNRLAILQMLREECGGECRLEADGGGKTVSEIASCGRQASSTARGAGSLCGAAPTRERWRRWRSS